ncbi:MAG: response regulator, partial [Proteobacteria bacterium]|nr:response regulator [Pseudomonadota bacterium]
EVHLSSLNGLNLIRSIRMMDSECLIICIGQSYSPEITKQSSDAGANQYFAKPIAVEAIIETMRRTKNIA